MACRLINSPITGKQETSRTWSELFSLTNNEEEADRLYKQLLSPEYIQKMGDWVTSSSSFKGELNEIGEPTLGMITLPGTYLSKKSAVPSSEANKDTLKKIDEFAKRVGIDLKPLSQLVINGVKLSRENIGDAIIGLADTVKGIAYIAEGKESIAKAEEVMHIAVQILKDKNSPLYKEMLNKIGGYQIYKSTVDTYGKAYRNEDGTLDVIKLKEEAMTKLLVERIIEKNEWGTENPELLAKADSWWDKVKEFFRNLFIKGKFDPFTEVAEQVLDNRFEGSVDDLNGGGDSFYSLQEKEDLSPEQTRVYKSILEQANKITYDQTGKKYQVNGVDVKNRVTDKAKAYYGKVFPGSDIEQSSQANIFAEKGTAGHADIQDIISRYTDENGFLRTTPLEKTDVSQLSPNDERIYQGLEDNISQRLLSFPAGTRFLTETPVYDPNKDEAGTIDFMAITPNGKVNILDWKFVNLDINKNKDIPSYKKEAYNIQIGEYKKILKDAYGVKEFGMTRAIPILFSFTFKDKEATLNGVKIGDANVSLEKYDYLLPVPTVDERTGDETIDKQIDKLNALYSHIQDSKVTEGRKHLKREQLLSVYKAIRELQVRKNISPTLSYAKILNKEAEDIVNTYKDTFEGVDSTSPTDESLNLYAHKILYLLDKYIPYEDIDVHLKDAAATNKDVQEDLKVTSSDVRSAVKDLNDTLFNFADKFLGDRLGVSGLITAERENKNIGNWFRGLGRGSTVAANSLYKLTNPNFQVAELLKEKEKEIVAHHREEYLKWSEARGLNPKNMFDLLYKKNSKGEKTNQRIDTIQSDFFKEFKKAQENKNTQWYKDNINLAAYREHIAQREQKRIAAINSTIYDAVDEENQKRRNEEIQKVKDKYNLSNDKAPGWGNNEMKSFALDKWHTDEYKQLLSPENKPVLDFYNYIQERVDKGVSLGILQPQVRRSFLPYVMKSGVAEKLAFGGNLKIADGFINGISINDNENTYQYQDPLTGKLINHLPFSFTSNRGIEDDSQFSTNLFSVIQSYNEQLIRYESLIGIENLVKTLQYVEHNKSSIQANRFGKIVRKDGVVQTSPENEYNAKMLDEFVQGIYYGQRNVNDILEGKTIGKIGERTENVFKAINKTLGTQLLPENVKDRVVTANGLLEGVSQFYKNKILALNIGIPLSNLIGGKLQNYTNKRTFFDGADLRKAEAMTDTRMFRGKEGNVYAYLLNQIVPFVEQTAADRKKELSVSKVANASMSEAVYSIFRYSDKLVQEPIAIAMLDNAVLIDGKIENTRQYVRAKYEGQRYFGTPGQNRELEEKMEKEIDDLKATKSLPKLAKIVDDKLVIDGLDLYGKEMGKLRGLIQQIEKQSTGAMSDDDRSRASMRTMARMMMTFKNWIVPIADSRFGSLKYIPGTDSYEYGKVRMVGKILVQNPLRIIGNMKNIMAGNEQGLKMMEEFMAKKKEQYLRETGKELTISKDDFYDLMRDNVRGQMRDILAYIGVLSTFLAAKALIPDADEATKEERGYWIYGVRMLDKISDEMAFYYHPWQWQQVAGGSILPAFGVVTDAENVLSNLGRYAFGLTEEELGNTTKGEKMVANAHPLKYVIKSFPLGNQLINYAALASPDFAKEMNIKFTTQNRAH